MQFQRYGDQNKLSHTSIENRMDETAQNAVLACADLIALFYSNSTWTRVEHYLRNTIFILDPNFSNALAGGSIEQLYCGYPECSVPPRTVKKMRSSLIHINNLSNFTMYLKQHGLNGGVWTCFDDRTGEPLARVKAPCSVIKPLFMKSVI